METVSYQCYIFGFASIALFLGDCFIQKSKEKNSGKEVKKDKKKEKELESGFSSSENFSTASAEEKSSWLILAFSKYQFYTFLLANFLIPVVRLFFNRNNSFFFFFCYFCIYFFFFFFFII
jgi:hypothetical protein